METKAKKRRFSAIDVFIVFAVIAILGSAALRFYYNSQTEAPVIEEKVLDEYVVSFVSKGVKKPVSDILDKGQGETVFYLTGGEKEFGVLESVDSITPAQIRVELADGKLQYGYALDETYDGTDGDINENNIKVDVTGKFTVKGYRNSNDLFYAAGSLYIAPNMSVTVFSDNMSFSFYVTDIEKVG